MAPKEQIEALIDLYENPDSYDIAFKNALKTVFATYTTAQVIAALELTNQATPTACATLSDWLPLFSQTHWEEMPKTAFLHLVHGTFVNGGLEGAGLSNDKFHELYLKHDPSYALLYSLSAKTQGTFLLFNLFPINRVEEIPKIQQRVATIPQDSLLPFFNDRVKKHATGHLARLLSQAQITGLPDPAFTNGVKTLNERGVLPPQKEDPNLTAWISRLAEKDDDGEGLLELLKNLHSFPFLETSTPEFLWNLLAKIPLYTPGPGESTESIRSRIQNGIGTQKWAQMLQNPDPDAVARIFQQGRLEKAADITVFVNYIRDHLTSTCYTTYCVSNGCANYLNKTFLQDIHESLRTLKADFEAKYRGLFGKELLNTPTEASKEFFSKNSWTLSRENLLILLTEKPEAFTAHVSGSKARHQKNNRKTARSRNN